MRSKRLVLAGLGCVLILLALPTSAQVTDKPGNPSHPTAGIFVNPTFTPPSTAPGYEAVLLASSLPGPRGLGVKPKGGEVYVVTENDHGLWHYQGGTLTFIMTTPVLMHGSRYKGGYLVGGEDGSIRKYVGGTTLKILTSYLTGDVYSLDVDAATGAVYFTSSTNVYRLPKGRTTPEYLTSLPGNSWGIAVKGNYLYITQYDYDLIYRMRKTGGPLSTFATGLNGPTDLVFDRHGNLYVAEFNSGSIAAIRARTSTVERIGWGFGEPYYIGVDRQGNVVFSDFGTYYLWVLKKK
jgi:DNA-binding beta-propeller fold protein YncE